MPDIYDRATAVFASIASTAPGAQRLDRITFGAGKCHGPMCMETYAALKNPMAFFTAAAAGLDAPNPARVARAMVAFRSWVPPDEDAIARDMDGPLARAADALADALRDVPQERWRFWKDAAWQSVKFYGGETSPNVTWVCVRYLLAELAGLRPNPFASYVGGMV